MPVARITTRIILLLLGISVAALSAGVFFYIDNKEREVVPEGDIGAEDYWYAVGRGVIVKSEDLGDRLVVGLLYKHGVAYYTVAKEALRDVNSKSRGLRRGLQSAADHAHIADEWTWEKTFEPRLHRMTGVVFKDSSTWLGWFKENAPYLTWSDQQGHFVIDETAKETQKPVAEYCELSPDDSRCTARRAEPEQAGEGKP